MAKKTTILAKTPTAAAKKTISTPVRNTPVPKVAAKKTIGITSEMVAKRAYEIHASGQGGSELDNWFAAERQLRAGI